MDISNSKNPFAEFQHTDPKRFYTDKNDNKQDWVWSGERWVLSTDVHQSYPDFPDATKYGDSGYEQVQAAQQQNKLSTSKDSALDVSFDVPVTLVPTGRKFKRTQDSRRRIRSSMSSQSSSESRQSRRCGVKLKFYLLAISSLVSLVIAVTCGVFIQKIMKKYDQLEQRLNSFHTSQALAQQDPIVCLSCAELSQGPLEEDNVQLDFLIKKDENGSEACCAKSSEQLRIMLNLYEARLQKKKQAEDLLRQENLTTTACGCIDTSSNTSQPRLQSVISAHLVPGEQMAAGNLDADNSPKIIKNWRFDEPGTHLTNINIADNSSLVVPETGNYFLYSQAGYLMYYDVGQDVNDEKQSLFHTVYRYSPAYPGDGREILLSSEITQCWEKERDFGRYTTYVGGTVILNKGDKLYVTVSNISALSKSRSTTYFGLFKIS